jgi:hypothetical protein
VSSDDLPSATPPEGTVDPDTAAAVLRAQLLDDLDGGEIWPMAHVESIINRRKLADTPQAHHVLVLDVLGALLDDQLILIGDVVGGDPAWIEPWPATPDDILARIRSLYVEQYTDRVKWNFSIWISPNDERKIWAHNTGDRRVPLTESNSSE